MTNNDFPIYRQEDGTIDYDRYRCEAAELRHVARTYYLGRLFAAIWQRLLMVHRPTLDSFG